MLKLFNARSSQIGVAIFLVVGGTLWEEWPRAGAARPYFPPTDLSSRPVNLAAEFNLTNADFAAQVDLWKNPEVPVYDTDLRYANYVFHSALHTENFDQLATRPTDNAQSYTLPVTVSGGHLDFAHFSLGTFNANLTLTPLKANSGDLFPTLLKPGISGSFNF